MPAVTLRLKGLWRVNALSGMAEKLKNAVKNHHALILDSRDLEALDTAGAFLLYRVLHKKLMHPPFETQTDYKSLYALVADYQSEIETHQNTSNRLTQRFLWPIYFVLERVGQLTVGAFEQLMAQSAFVGKIMMLLLATLINPTRLRMASIVNVMQRAGIEAVPIVLMTNLFVGAVVAFLGVLTLQELGGLGIFAVEMIGMSVLREFAPMITAVFLAGRSASSFAAEIGTMKMRQEIDAMMVMGIDPYEALVVPRVLGLVFMTPLVTFLGAIAGMIGGALVVWALLNLGLPFFAERILDYVPIENFVVGMIKTPFFAATVAIVGCRLGMTVKSDVVSLGKQVTSAVVQATFLIFMLDAIFAIIFRGLRF